jgi:low affinity Fe/Cu permease
MVFLIQNMQNRDAKAMQLKLDELIKATTGARNSLMDLDRLTDEEMHQLEHEYKRLCSQHINAGAKQAMQSSHNA